VTAPLIILHRRNRIDMLSALPPGAWIEIDIDVHDGDPILTHDPVTPKSGKAARLAEFLPQAIRRGVAGFAFDCKRENVELAVEPLLAQHKVENYFYFNETEIQGDMFLAAVRAHKSAVRVWQYRGARDVIRYVEDMKKAKQNGPAWAWIDSWQRGVLQDIGKAVVPLNQADARNLQKLGVKLCIGSPELYAHDYEKTYKITELEEIYRGVVRYRERLLQTGIQPDSACTKFPWLWTMEINLLLKAKRLGVGG
jgi:hypothetical protein